MCLRILKELVPDLDIAGTAGLSLGEFTAHCAAGTFNFPTGLDLVAKRGRFMEEATSSTEGTMAAMIGGDEEKVAELATINNIDIANYNAPGQIVVSGAKDGVLKAIAGAKEYGIRIAKEMDVAGAYHSRLMLSAQEKLAPELAQLELNEPEIRLVCNVDASLVTTPDDIRSTLVRQVSGSVRWSDSIQKFIADGDTNFIEIGPGSVLSGLMKRIDRRATIADVHDCATIEEVADILNEAAPV
jgi:[acyl-carrier-protein] S-malonyltransferase